MIRTFLIFLLLPALLMAETHVGGECEGGVWDVEGSPYIVDRSVELLDGVALTIEPGVIVLFSQSTSILAYEADLVAEGTVEDSIIFTGVDDAFWHTIYIEGEDAIVSFDYCFFSRSSMSDIFSQSACDQALYFSQL